MLDLESGEFARLLPPEIRLAVSESLDMYLSAKASADEHLFKQAATSGDLEDLSRSVSGSDPLVRHSATTIRGTGGSSFDQMLRDKAQMSDMSADVRCCLKMSGKRPMMSADVRKTSDVVRRCPEISETSLCFKEALSLPVQRGLVLSCHHFERSVVLLREGF